MLGSQASVADPNIVLNTIAAQAFAEAVEVLSKAKDFDKACREYSVKLLKEHYRIIFNYNGYGPDWEPEAERRGLLNNKTTADAALEFFKQENIDVFVKQGVFTEKEVVARADIMLENYVKTINIEALTTAEMARREIYPAVNRYVTEVASAVQAKRAVSESISCGYDLELVERLSRMNDALMAGVEKLERDLTEIPEGQKAASRRMAHAVVPDMEEVRRVADGMEKLCAREYWPFPSYTDLLYSVK